MSSCNTFDKKYWKKSPNRNLHDKGFTPILNIPLTRVHICTMHAFCRIIEKLIHLYIKFSWKEKNISIQKENLTKIEKILSDIGLHGGKVKIIEYPKRSIETHKVACKPSIGGVKARGFLSFNGELGKINSK